MNEQQEQPKPKTKGKLRKRLIALMMLAIVGLVLSIALTGGGDGERAEQRQAPEAVSQSGVRVVELTPPRLEDLPGHDGTGISGAYQACIVCHGGIFNGR